MSKLMSDRDPTGTGLEMPPDATPASIVDAAAERRLVRKLDLRIMPWLILLYLLNFLDRANIGNAKIANTDAANKGGLYTDLDLKDWQYNLSISIFFVGYILFEIPSNLLLKRFTPSAWLGRIIAVWGLISMLQFTVKSASGLLAIRFFLGVAEAGFLPGVVLYMTFWYLPHERARRIAYIIASATLSGAFSGLLGFAISYLDNRAGLRGWQWIFLLEGIPTILAGIATFWVLPDFPDSIKSTWLTEDEKRIACDRLDATATRSSDSNFDPAAFRKTWTDWRTYFFMLMYISLCVPFYSMSYFLPSLIKGLGWTSLKANYMTVPPYCSGWLITVALATSSDKRRERPGHLAFALGLALVCFVILAATRDIKADYAAFFFLTGALCGAAPLALSWRTDHLSGSATHAAIATAAMVTFGNAGGIISGQVYPSSDGPTFRKGHIVNACFLAFGIALTAVGAAILPRAGSKDDRLWDEKGRRDDTLSVDHTHTDLAVDEGRGLK